MNLKWLDFFFLLQVFSQRNVALQALSLHGCQLQPPVLGDPKPLLQLSDEHENATKAAHGLWLWFTVSSSLHWGFPFLTYDLKMHWMLNSFHIIQHHQMLKTEEFFHLIFILLSFQNWNSDTKFPLYLFMRMLLSVGRNTYSFSLSISRDWIQI